MGAPLNVGPPTSACDGKAAENLAVGGVATASDVGEDPTESPAAAFDDNTGTKWAQGKNPRAWLAYEFAGGAAHVVKQYAVGPAPDGSKKTDPVSFELQGSNDGASWTTLHRRQGHQFFNREALTWFAVKNETAYPRYRLLVTENGGGPGVELGELQLHGAGTPVFSIDNTLMGPGQNEFSFSRGWDTGKRDTEVKEWKFGRSSTWTKQKDATMTFKFTGSRIQLYGVRDPNHGLAAIALDDGPEQLVDFYGPTSGNILLFESPVLCPSGTHALHVRQTGQKRPQAGETFISLDRVRITP